MIEMWDLDERGPAWRAKQTGPEETLWKQWDFDMYGIRRPGFGMPADEVAVPKHDSKKNHSLSSHTIDPEYMTPEEIATLKPRAIAKFTGRQLLLCAWKCRSSGYHVVADGFRELAQRKGRSFERIWERNKLPVPKK